MAARPGWQRAQLARSASSCRARSCEIEAHATPSDVARGLPERKGPRRDRPLVRAGGTSSSMAGRGGPGLGSASRLRAPGLPARADATSSCCKPLSSLEMSAEFADALVRDRVETIKGGGGRCRLQRARLENSQLRRQALSNNRGHRRLDLRSAQHGSQHDRGITGNTAGRTRDSGRHQAAGSIGPKRRPGQLQAHHHLPSGLGSAVQHCTGSARHCCAPHHVPLVASDCSGWGHSRGGSSTSHSSAVAGQRGCSAGREAVTPLHPRHQRPSSRGKRGGLA